MLSQRYCWVSLKSRRRTTSNKRWNNVVYVNVVIYNVERRRINVVYFNVDINNNKKRCKNIAIFNLEFHDAVQHRNIVANMTTCKKLKNKPRVKSKIIFFSLKWKAFKNEYGLLLDYYWTTTLDYYFKILFNLIPISREIWRRTTAKPQKFLKHRENAILQELCLNRFTL